MVYRYPVAQLIVGFGSAAVGVLVCLAMAIGFFLQAFAGPEQLGGNVFFLLLEALFLSGVALAVFVIRYFYPRKRPVVADHDAIACLNPLGQVKTELRWNDVEKIDRQFLYDPFSSRNGYSFAVYGRERVLYFDDSIEDVSSLIQMLNHEISAHNIYANSIERGFDVFAGVTDPVERRKLAKNGRASRVTAF